jgi:hypothetical protein
MSTQHSTFTRWRVSYKLIRDKKVRQARKRASTASIFSRDPSLPRFKSACSIGKSPVVGAITEKTLLQDMRQRGAEMMRHDSMCSGNHPRASHWCTWSGNTHSQESLKKDSRAVCCQGRHKTDARVFATLESCCEHHTRRMRLYHCNYFIIAWPFNSSCKCWKAVSPSFSWISTHSWLKASNSHVVAREGSKMI